MTLTLATLREHGAEYSTEDLLLALRCCGPEAEPIAREVACRAAERVLHLTGDARPACEAAIKAGRDYTAGLSTTDDLAVAWDAARDAARAASGATAPAAAWAASRVACRDASRGVSQAAWAAWEAAAAAAWASARAASRAAAWDSALARAEAASRQDLIDLIKGAV